MGLSTFELAQLGMAGAGAGLQAYGANQATKQNKEQLAMQRRLEAMRNQQNLDMQLLNRRDNQAVNFADANPLGQEMDFARKQAIRNAILPQLVKAAGSMGGPTDPGIQRSFRPAANPLQGLDLSGILKTTSPDATAASLADRRMITGGLNPEAAQFRPSLSNFGLDPTGQWDALTQTRATEQLGQQDEAEAALREQAKAQLNLTEEQAQELERKGGGGFWKKLAKVGIIAGGAALMATGVGGPAGAAIIGAAAGAGSGALDGGWKGALVGGGLGALTGGMGGGAAGASAARAAGATTGQLARQAILNPQTIAQMTGAGIGGRAGSVIGLASNFLPGANFNAGANTRGGFEGNNPEIAAQSLGLGNLNTNAGPAPLLAGGRTGGYQALPGALTQNGPSGPPAAGRAAQGATPSPRLPQPFPNAPQPNFSGNRLFQGPGPFPGAQPNLPPPGRFPTGTGPSFNGPLMRPPSFPGAQPGLPPPTNFGRPQLGPPRSALNGLGQMSDQDFAGLQAAATAGPPGLPPAQIQPGQIPDPRFLMATGGNAPPSFPQQLGLVSAPGVQGGSPGGVFPGMGGHGSNVLQAMLRQRMHGPFGMPPAQGYGPAGLGQVFGGSPAAQMPQGFSPQLQQMLSQLPDGALRNFLMRGGA